jgi:CRP/FNR family cyclic AMP-dependent transcriptional regulator
MISPEVLRSHPYFAGISDESLKQLAMIAEEKKYPANTRIINEGDPASHMLLIVKGEVHIQYLLGNGELRTVDTLGKGDVLGWSALIEPYKMSAHCTTVKDTELVGLDAVKLRQMCEKDSLLGFRLTTHIAKLLAHRLESARVQLATV